MPMLRSPDLNAAPQKKSDAVRLTRHGRALMIVVAGTSPAMTLVGFTAANQGPRKIAGVARGAATCRGVAMAL